MFRGVDDGLKWTDFSNLQKKKHEKKIVKPQTIT